MGKTNRPDTIRLRQPSRTKVNRRAISQLLAHLADSAVTHAALIYEELDEEFDGYEKFSQKRIN